MFVRTNRRAIAMMFVRLPDSEGRALRSPDLSLRCILQCSGHLDTAVPTVFFQFHLEWQWGME